LKASASSAGGAPPGPRGPGAGRLRERRKGKLLRLTAAICGPRLPHSAKTLVKTATHIAVLDDEVDITTLVAGYLRGHGYRVSQLHEGRALMQLMPADPPALVLLDLGLPGEDGFSIARQLREHWRCGLVIVTGRGDAVDAPPRCF
jgi:PleD family two-component response regulator